MALNPFSEQAYQQIIERLSKLETQLQARKLNATELFLDNQEFMQVMNISKRTAQSWRDSKTIPFSQVGHKIYYMMHDILTLLHNSRIDACKPIDSPAKHPLADGNSNDI